MLNWLVVGIGDISAKRVIPAIQAEPRSTLYGVVSRDPAKGRQFSERAWNDLGTALWDPKIDAVYIATPVALHAPQTLMALRAGKHVLCEKPMAMHFEEGKAMVGAAKTAGRMLGVSYYRRVYPKVQRARELMMQGMIGQPVLAWACCHDQIPAKDGFRGWLIDPQMAGGGPLYDIACHRIDLANYLLGEPMAVCAHLSNLIHDIPVEDSATLIVEHRTGCRSIIDARWHSSVERDEFRIIGTDGELDLSPVNGSTLRTPKGVEDIPAPANRHFPCIENFVSALLDGKPLISSGETALQTDWAIEQAVTSEA